jgi:RNA polymerase sigma factor (sigma-70 family)
VVYRPWAAYATVRESACRWLTKLRCEPDVAEDMSASIAEAITRQMEKNPALRAADANGLDRYAFVAARRRLKRTLAQEDAHDEWNERFRASSERECSEAERPDVMFERRQLAEAIFGGAQTLVGQQQTYFVCEFELGMSREEIAERFGVTRASVDATLSRAYAAMRRWLTAQGYTFDLDVRTSRKEDA